MVTQSRAVVVYVWGGGGVRTKGYGRTFGGERNVLYQDFGDDYITAYICQNHQIIHPNLDVNYIPTKLISKIYLFSFSYLQHVHSGLEKKRLFFKNTICPIIFFFSYLCPSHSPL